MNYTFIYWLWILLRFWVPSVYLLTLYNLVIYCPGDRNLYISKSTKHLLAMYPTHYPTSSIRIISLLKEIIFFFLICLSNMQFETMFAYT